MFKTQVELRAAGEWFHCQVLNILWHHFIILYSFINNNNNNTLFVHQYHEQEIPEVIPIGGIPLSNQLNTNQMKSD